MATGNWQLTTLTIDISDFHPLDPITLPAGWEPISVAYSTIEAVQVLLRREV
jgi:hypothetical protein